MIEIKKEKNMGKICWPNTGRGESHIPGALHCRSSTCLIVKLRQGVSSARYVCLFVHMLHIKLYVEMSRPNEHVLHNLGTPIINIKTKISLVGPRYKTWLCIKMKLEKSQNQQNTYFTRLGCFYATAILS